MMKHLDKMTKFCFAGYLLTLSTFTLACNPGQGSGQCGYYDNSGYHNAPIGSYSGNNYKQPTRVIKLPSRYGAVAWSEGGGSGMSHNRLSEKEAAEAAMQYCKNAGGLKCVIAAEVRNSCIAISTGQAKNGSGTYGNVATGQPEDTAIQNAINKCKASGFSDCKILDVSCSIPTLP